MAIDLIRVLEVTLGSGAAVVATYLAMRPRVHSAEERAVTAENARRDIELQAENLRKAAVLEAREESMRLREAADQEIREKKAAFDRVDEKLTQREDAIEARRAEVEQRERDILDTERAAREQAVALDRREEEIEAALASTAKLSKSQAQELYLKRLEPELREEVYLKVREIEAATLPEVERKAKRMLVEVMERNTVEYVTEATVAIMNIPSEDMKGRIIGREGRNIRAFEQITGVDLIIDDTPESVLISCFDPVRRETARLALMNLMIDGRIHPGRIEELYEKAQIEVQRTIEEAGERAAERASVTGLPPRVIEMMGRLRFRTSYAQNILDHSVEVAALAVMLANELGLNVEVARRAGFLHDVGKALGPEWEGPHAITGMEFLKQQGEKEAILHAVGAHHREIEPNTCEALVVIVADALSAARPGARRENLENYIKRLNTLENLANAFPGVERSYAVQAGREIRLLVKPEQVDDAAARRLAADVARRIESELDFPGQIKVTVIRETRATEVAR